MVCVPGYGNALEPGGFYGQDEYEDFRYDDGTTSTVAKG